MQEKNENDNNEISSGMFRFFEYLPEEITLKIFGKTSRKDQASLMQVNKQFSRITGDDSLDLFRYKSETKIHRVGEVCLVIQKIEEDHWARKSGKTHRGWILKNREEVNGSSWFISKFMRNYRIRTDDLFEAMGKETSLLIEKLKQIDSTKNSVLLLQEAISNEKVETEKLTVYA
jgi:hypothetical protein